MPKDVDLEHEWLAVGARQKAESIIRLVRDLEISSVLEVGAGTGSVLEELDRRGFADTYYAVEPSPTMCRYIKEKAKISRLVEAEAATLESASLAGRSYDLVILSHVLEHLEDPSSLLARALDLGTFVLAEVPLEGTWQGNLRARLKTALTGLPRMNNPAGHIQFFSQGDFSKLIMWSGGEIVSERLYSPQDATRALLSQQTGPRRMATELTYRLSVLFGEDRWARLYHGHYATLLRRRSSIPTERRTTWSQPYYYEASNPEADDAGSLNNAA